MNTRHAMLMLGLILSASTYSQNYFYNNKYYDADIVYELAISAGAMNCLTDLGGTTGIGKGFVKDLNLPNTRLTAGAQVGLIYRSAVGLRLEFNYGTVTASDAVLKNDATAGRYRYQRNLHFRSKITDFLLMGEVYPLPIVFPPDEHAKASRFAPYITGGIGIFKFNPQAALNGQWVALQPLHTEGQGFEIYPERKLYALTQINFPAGIGCRYEVSAIFNIRLELVHRFTRTDYLDDVSTTYVDPVFFNRYLDATSAQQAYLLSDRQAELNPAHVTQPGAVRGNNKKRDTYFSAVLKLGLLLGRERR